MYLTARITTSCPSENTRYTRLNLLGWAALCPYARDLLWHGSTPIQPCQYPTGEEADEAHKALLDGITGAIAEAVEDSGYRLVKHWREYKLSLTILRGEEKLCARSKADLVLLIGAPSSRSLRILYVEAATRIHVAKPWQVLLRGLALYYQYRLPVWLAIVSPEKIMYKELTGKDQDKILRALNRDSSGYQPSPNLCSLCELAHQCPYKAI